MPWAKIDDSFPEHPKVEAVGPMGGFLHVRMICYCARNLTDGFVPNGAALRMAADLAPGTLKGNVDVRVEGCKNGLIRQDGAGYWVNDYLVYNPSKEQVLKDRAAAKERMDKVRSKVRSGERTGEQSDEHAPVVQPPRTPAFNPRIDPPDLDPSSSGEDSGSSRSASHGVDGPPKSAAKERKPRASVLEQAGLVGDCAREWAAKYGRPPTWGREVVKLNELAQAHGSDEVLRRWKNYLASVDGFYAGHPVTLFVANGQFDRFVGGAAGRPTSDLTQKFSTVDTEVIDATPVAGKM